MALLQLLSAPMGAAGVVPADGAVCRATWLCVRVGAGEGTCYCFRELLEGDQTANVKNRDRSTYEGKTGGERFLGAEHVNDMTGISETHTSKEKPLAKSAPDNTLVPPSHFVMPVQSYGRSDCVSGIPMDSMAMPGSLAREAHVFIISDHGMPLVEESCSCPVGGRVPLGPVGEEEFLSGTGDCSKQDPGRELCLQPNTRRDTQCPQVNAPFSWE
ncbi:hypothetical protein UY3_19157 [Chelonia mydas]|uniref:Uncharacterized protein n=1 Tax=Chelonia mydas TaxID=8469 RepID=M7ALZ0_CHEMY|nr:hypothetical protein UY3_19157 [Chelonia mydas]